MKHEALIVSGQAGLLPCYMLHVMCSMNVVLIGRTNVGKSTLFNRLVGGSRAITSPLPETTRDLLRAEVSWGRHSFTLWDTGGLDVEMVSDIEKNVIAQVDKAIKKADLIIFVTDVTTDLLPRDREVAKRLRKTSKPVILTVNKCDAPRKRAQAVAFHELGLEPVIPVSAITGSGTGDLLDEVVARLSSADVGGGAGAETPTARSEDEHRRGAQATGPLTSAAPLRITILGRPNVGKSSLLNAILGEERAIVSELPHTTRDVQDAYLKLGNQYFVIIDTAGIRKKAPLKKHIRSLEDRLERQSIDRSLAAAERSDVIVLVIESHLSLSHQDLALAKIAAESGKAVVIAINKWDLVPNKDAQTITTFKTYFKRKLPHLSFASLVFVSAKTRQRVLDILAAATSAHCAWSSIIPAPELDYLIKKEVKLIFTKDPNKQKGKRLKLYGLKQLGAKPPVFCLYTNRVKMPEAIPNIVEKKLREKFGLAGTPVKIEVRSMKF